MLEADLEQYIKELSAIDRAGIDKDYKAAAKGYTNLNKAVDAFFATLPKG